MSLLTMIPLLLAGAANAEPDWPARWQQCRTEAAPLVRLACYDAIGAVPPPPEAALRSPAWLAIAAQEEGRVEGAPAFLLEQRESGDLLLTRPAQRGATLAIGCINDITQLRVRLDASWIGEGVVATLDGAPVSGNWFVRDSGMLLEFGRGLPAIDELKRWRAGRELTLQGEGGPLLRFDLFGLSGALKPLRQQCRW